MKIASKHPKFHFPLICVTFNQEMFGKNEKYMKQLELSFHAETAFAINCLIPPSLLSYVTFLFYVHPLQQKLISEMNTPIRKLPGAKKEFPLVKSVIDNRSPVGYKTSIPAKPRKDAVERKPDDPTTITPEVSAKQAVLQTRPPWNPSTKIAPTPILFIKPLPGTKKTMGHLQRIPFKARSIPRGHTEPFRPVLASKIQSHKNLKKDDGSRITGMETSDDKPVEEVFTDALASVPTESPNVPDKTVEVPEKAVEMLPDQSEEDPGFFTDVLESQVDPVLHAEKNDDEDPAGEIEEVKQLGEEEFQATEDSDVPVVMEKNE